MAKPRTEKQKRATRKMIAANRAKRRGTGAKVKRAIKRVTKVVTRWRTRPAKKKKSKSRKKSTPTTLPIL